MTEIGAADAARRFAEVMDVVARRSATFTGRPVVTIAPVCRGRGADLRRILAEHPPDDAWADELRDLRCFMGTAPRRLFGD